MPYHVRITPRSNQSHDEIRLDLSEDELHERFIMPFRQGRPIVIGGRVVPSEDLLRIHINWTDETSDRLLPAIRAERAADSRIVTVSDDWFVTSKGRDLTDELITGPPGEEEAGVEEEATPPPSGSPRDVFVVHGRNLALRDAMFTFLRAIGLHPIEWSEAVMQAGSPSPYVGEILDCAFRNAQAIVVLFTPDDTAFLREPYRLENDPPFETEPTPQARPNVLFEAGMAMGRSADRTVLVEIGTLRPFSDVGGRHVVRLDNSTQRRQELAQRLQTAGCSVNTSGTDWHTAGNLSVSD